MSVQLKSELSDFSLLLHDPTVDIDQFAESEEFSYEFPDVGNAVDKKGRIRYFHVELWEGTPDYLDHIISYLEQHPVPGTYTVEELGLYDVPFVEVLKAIKKLYEKKLTTPTQK